MGQIVLDFGSGNTSKNDYTIIPTMIDELAKVDSHKHEVIIKWQLFLKAGDNVPLKQEAFDFAYKYAMVHGYKTTASVFDLPSSKFLLNYDIPFVKIANNRSLDYLIGDVPRKILVYQSLGWLERSEYIDISTISLLCVSKYPAEVDDYKSKMLFVSNIENQYSFPSSYQGISDHTIGLDLFKKFQPAIWEKHYKLSDSTGLDAGPFAITPEELKEIL